MSRHPLIVALDAQIAAICGPGPDPFYDDVREADCPPPESVGIADDIPMPRDPYAPEEA